MAAETRASPYPTPEEKIDLLWVQEKAVVYWFAENFDYLVERIEAAMGYEIDWWYYMPWYPIRWSDDWLLLRIDAAGVCNEDRDCVFSKTYAWLQFAAGL